MELQGTLSEHLREIQFLRVIQLCNRMLNKLYSVNIEYQMIIMVLNQRR
jgi:hypothetical protein